jgi:cell division topological specificity factor
LRFITYEKPGYSVFSEVNKHGLAFFFINSKKTANVAKERWIIIARELLVVKVGFLPALREELIAVFSKYTKVSRNITVSLDKQGNLEVLDVNVVLPELELRN